MYYSPPLNPSQLFSDEEVDSLVELVEEYSNLKIYTHLARMHLFIEYIRIMQTRSKKPIQSPLEVLIAITDRCNSRCIHCWADGLNSGNEIPTEKAKEVIKKLLDSNILHISLSGGEPLLRKDIFDLVSYMKDHSVSVSLLTNGLLLNEKTVSKLSKMLDDDDIIQVSLDGPDENTYLRQRGVNAFNKVVNGIRLLKESGINVRVNFVSTFLNTNKLVDTYLLVNELGVDIFSCTPLYPYSKGEKIYSKLVEIEYLKELLKLPRIKSELGLKTHLYIVLPLQVFEVIYDKYPKRGAPVHMPIFLSYENSVISINVRGDVYIGQLSFPEFKLGNILEENLRDMWDRAHEKELLPLTRDLSGTKCEECKFLHLCKGGDTALTYRRYRTLNKPDPYCMLDPNLRGGGQFD